MVVVALQRGVPATLEALVAAALVKSRVAEAAGAAGAVAAREGPGYLADAAAVKVASGVVRLAAVVRVVAALAVGTAARMGAKVVADAAMAMGAAEAAVGVGMVADKVDRRNCGRWIHIHQNNQNQTVHQDNCRSQAAGGHGHVLYRTCQRGSLVCSRHHTNSRVCSHTMGSRRESAEGKGRL